MPDKEYSSYKKTYGKGVNPSDVLKSIRSGSRGVMGSEATAAKKFLRSSPDYETVKVSGGTLYKSKKGNSGYISAGGGMGPSQVRKASPSDLKEAREKLGAKSSSKKK